MAVCQLQPQRPLVRSCAAGIIRPIATLQPSLLPVRPRLHSFSSKHSTFCARNSLASRVGHAPASSRFRKDRQAIVAGFWFRSSHAAGSAAASAAAAQAAAILSVPLWQHAAQSACLVVATLAVAVTVSKFLIINSGKLEAGEVRSTYLHLNLLLLLLSYHLTAYLFTHMLQQLCRLFQDRQLFSICNCLDWQNLRTFLTYLAHSAGGHLDGFC